MVAPPVAPMQNSTVELWRFVYIGALTSLLCSTSATFPDDVRDTVHFSPALDTAQGAVSIMAMISLLSTSASSSSLDLLSAVSISPMLSTLPTATSPESDRYFCILLNHQILCS